MVLHNILMFFNICVVRCVVRSHSQKLKLPFYPKLIVVVFKRKMTTCIKATKWPPKVAWIFPFMKIMIKLVCDLSYKNDLGQRS